MTLICRNMKRGVSNSVSTEFLFTFLRFAMSFSNLNNIKELIFPKSSRKRWVGFLLNFLYNFEGSGTFGVTFLRDVVFSGTILQWYFFKLFLNIAYEVWVLFWIPSTFVFFWGLSFYTLKNEILLILLIIE